MVVHIDLIYLGINCEVQKVNLVSRRASKIVYFSQQLMLTTELEAMFCNAFNLYSVINFGNACKIHFHRPWDFGNFFYIRLLLLSKARVSSSCGIWMHSIS